MKIIIRDILNSYFPKYSPIYQSLTTQQKQSIIKTSSNINHHNNQHNNHNYDNRQKQLQQRNKYIPLQLISKRSSSSNNNIKQKSINNISLSRSKSKQDNYTLNMKSKQLNQKLPTQKQYQKLNNSTNYQYKSSIQNKQLLKQNKQLSIQNKQLLKQLINQKLNTQIKLFIQQHRFYNQNINIQSLLYQLSLIILYCNTQLTNNNTNYNKHRSFSKQSINYPTSSLQQNIYKLSLYLNKQTNKQIFSVYQNILTSNPKTGISYQTLSKKLKTDIINVSHYCCKLKKMRFIDWEHKKQGIVVFPKIQQSSINNNNNNKNKHKSQQKHYQMTEVPLIQNYLQPSFNYSKSFLFNQLTLNQNILINISSSNSLLQGGLTNEQIKYKIMKHAQNKMVRRTVQGMKNIQRNAQRQGKVFEFKYKKQTIKIIKQMDKKRIQSSGIIQLTQKCRKYLNSHYSINSNHSQINNSLNSPNNIVLQQLLQNQNLLQHIINTKLTDYYSSIGIKQSKRQCTPLKLNRYIYILNYLQRQGPQNELDLRRYIIDVQKQSQNNQGIIHKRSVVGILQGLKKIQLIEQIDNYYYPKWVTVKKKQKLISQTKQQKYIRQGNQQYNELWSISNGINTNKKIKLDKSINNNFNNNNSKNKSNNINNVNNNKNKLVIPQQKIRMISKRQHLNEIFVQLINFIFQKAFKRILRKSFHRIMYCQRKKQSIPIFTPQNNIFHLLDLSPNNHHIVNQFNNQLNQLNQQNNNNNKQLNQQQNNNKQLSVNNKLSHNKLSPKLIQQHETTLQLFMQQITNFIFCQGNKLINFPQVQYQVVKYVRKNPSKNADNLRSKYGKSWKQKFEPLQKQRIITINDNGYSTTQNFNKYLV